MFVRSRNIVLSRLLSNAIIGGLSVVPGTAFLVTPRVKLFTAGPAPITPDTVPADFTEATFVGYAQQPLTLPLIGPLLLGADELAATNQVTFVAGAVVPPGQQILGYWVEHSSGGSFVFSLGETFQTPIPIALLGDFISLDVLYAISMGLALNN